MKNKATIYTTSLVVRNLLKHELLGQFSDGRWENSRNESWKYLDTVELNTDMKNGVQFKNGQPWQYSGYTCNDSDLKKYIGTRLWVNAIVSDYFKDKLDIKTIDSIVEIVTDIDACDSLPRSKKVRYEFNPEDLDERVELFLKWSKEGGSSNYYTKKYEEMKALVENYKTEITECFENTTYTKVDLSKDLDRCTETLKTMLNK